MTEVFFSYNEYTTGGEIYEGQEDNPYPDRSPSYTHRTYYDAYLNGRGNVESNIWFDQEECAEEVKVGDTVYLVDVTYASGDTFGQDLGYHRLIGVYLDEVEAIQVQSSITNNTYTGYKPWDGYFEFLQDVVVIPFTVKE